MRDDALLQSQESREKPGSGGRNRVVGMSTINGAQSKAAKILIVDDEPDVCELLSRWLTSEGYSCDTANNGQMAVQLLEQKDFDLLISDIMMPGCPGLISLQL